MSRIDLTINRETLAKNVRKARENNVIIPTFHQMQIGRASCRERVCMFV